MHLSSCTLLFRRAMSLFQRENEGILTCTYIRETRSFFINKLPPIFKNKFIYFIYLFLAVLGLRCCRWAFTICGERGLLFVAVHGLLFAVASLVVEHRL